MPRHPGPQKTPQSAENRNSPGSQRQPQNHAHQERQQTPDDVRAQAQPSQHQQHQQHGQRQNQQQRQQHELQQVQQQQYRTQHGQRSRQLVYNLRPAPKPALQYQIQQQPPVPNVQARPLDGLDTSTDCRKPPPINKPNACTSQASTNELREIGKRVLQEQPQHLLENCFWGFDVKKLLEDTERGPSPVRRENNEWLVKIGQKMKENEKLRASQSFQPEPQQSRPQPSGTHRTRRNCRITRWLDGLPDGEAYVEDGYGNPSAAANGRQRDADSREGGNGSIAPEESAGGDPNHGPGESAEDVDEGKDGGKSDKSLSKSALEASEPNL